MLANLSSKHKSHFVESEDSFDEEEMVDEALVSELKRKVQPPESTIADNRKLRDQWIDAVVEFVSDLKDKIEFMEGEKITKKKDTLQAQFNKSRIKEIFDEYQKKGMIFA